MLKALYCWIWEKRSECPPSQQRVKCTPSASCNSWISNKCRSKSSIPFAARVCHGSRLCAVAFSQIKRKPGKSRLNRPHDLKMRVISAYLLVSWAQAVCSVPVESQAILTLLHLQAVLGGNESPGADDIKSILSSGNTQVAFAEPKCDINQLQVCISSYLPLQCQSRQKTRG